MRMPIVLAVAALAASLATPATAGMSEEPVGGNRCSMGFSRAPGQQFAVYEIVGLVPLLPVTAGGDVVTDAALSCTIVVDPDGAEPTVTLTSTTVPVAGVGIMPPVVQVVQTGAAWTETRCQALTWTDTSRTPQSWSDCTTDHHVAG